LLLRKTGLLTQPRQENVVFGYFPVPDRGILCGVFGALSLIVTAPVSSPVCFGVKVTLMLQVFPAATVPTGLPHVFVPLTRAKSPLIVMLLKVSVAVPVLVSVTVFGAVVVPTLTVPHDREVGDRVTAGPLPLAFTVRLSVVVFVKLPDTPLTVTVTVPVAADALAVSVNVLVVVVGFGLNPAVTPLGKPEALKVTLPVKPFTGFTVIVLVPLFPCVTVTELGFAVRLKFGAAAAFTVRLNVVVFVKLPDVPVMVTVTVPVAAEPLAVNVSVLVEAAGFGLNPAVTPLGKPDAESVTLPLKPFRGVMVMVLVPLLPCVIVTLFGEAESVKFGPAGPARALIRLVPFGLPQPVAKS
jgi:hypothetical protein